MPCGKQNCNSNTQNYLCMEYRQMYNMQNRNQISMLNIAIKVGALKLYMYMI